MLKISIPVLFLAFLTLSILLRKKLALVKLALCESVISKSVIAYQSLAILSLLDTSCNSNFNPARQMLKTITSAYNYSGQLVKPIITVDYNQRLPLYSQTYISNISSILYQQFIKLPNDKNVLELPYHPLTYSLLYPEVIGRDLAVLRSEIC